MIVLTRRSCEAWLPWGIRVRHDTMQMYQCVPGTVAVESAAARPPAATNAITQLGSCAISGFASTTISRST